MSVSSGPRARFSERARVAAVALLVTAAVGCTSTPDAPAELAAERQLFGVYVGFERQGDEQMAAFERFLGTKLRVGHGYLDGSRWESVSRPGGYLDQWTQWKAQNPDGLFVLNVPMAAPNEGERGEGAPLSDSQTATLLRAGAAGEHDDVYASLAKTLVAEGLADTVLIPGWEMNGTQYSHRCEPDPEAWKGFWRRIVTVMRAEPGQRFRFDFNPSRGTDAISWKRCYPGDDVVDIIGMDTYDQPNGARWEQFVDEPDGLADHADFAAEHGKPISFPEWGLFRNGDNPEFVANMLRWIAEHDTVYHTFTDYCPHGVVECRTNPRSAATFQQMLGDGTGADPGPADPDTRPTSPGGGDDGPPTGSGDGPPGQDGGPPPGSGDGPPPGQGDGPPPGQDGGPPPGQGDGPPPGSGDGPPPGFDDGPPR